MFLRKIVSTFVCFCLFGCFGCVRGMEKGKVIAVKEGDFQCGSSVMSYTLGITPSNSSGDINVMCHIQDSSQDSSGSDESGSLLSDTRYKIHDALWMYDTECANTFLDAISSKLVKLKGGTPSHIDVDKIKDDIFHRISKTINNVKQFQTIKIADMNGIRNMVFEGVELNGDFLHHFNGVIIDPLCTIKFTNCKLQGKVTFAEILDGCIIKNLSIINSGLTVEDVRQIFITINQYSLRNLDISNNNLGQSVIGVLKNRISGTFGLDSLVLTGNNLEQGDVEQIGGVRNVVI